MEQDLRLREVQVNVEQNGGGEGGVHRSNRGNSVAMKALKLPLFNDEKLMFFIACCFIFIKLNGEGASPFPIPHPFKKFLFKKENDNVCELKGGVQ